MAPPSTGKRHAEAESGYKTVLDAASKIGKEVGKTVEQLQDLEAVMHGDGFQFGNAAYEYLLEISETLNQLEKCCQHLRESLEAETIVCSSLRHEKAMFPIKLRKEVNQIMFGLRRANEKQLNEVKGQLDVVEGRISTKENRLQFVRTEVQRLKPDVEKSQKEHANEVEELNEVMAEKAKWRIRLNGTIAADERTVRHRKKLDKQVEDLQQALKEERQRAEKEIAELKGRTAECKGEISEKQAEIYTMEREISEMQTVNGFLQEDIEQRDLELGSLKLAVEMITDRKTALKQQFDTTCRKVINLEKKGKEIVAGQKRETEQHRKRMDVLRDEQAELEKNIAYAEEEEEKLRPQYNAVKKGYDRSKKRAASEGGRLGSIQVTVDEAKASLLEATKKSSAVSQDLEEAIALQRQLEQGVIAQQAQAKESLQVAKERLLDKKARKLQKQKDRDRVMAEKSTQEAEQSQTHSATAKEFETSKVKCEKLETEAVDTEERLKSGGAEITHLRQEFLTLRTQFDKTKVSLEERLEYFTEAVETLRGNLATNECMLLDLKPAAAELRDECGACSQGYEEDKKGVVELKNKRAGYQDQLTRAEREIEKLHLPQERLRNEIRTQRSAGAAQLQEQSAETIDIDQRVWHARRRTDTLRVENQRFVEAIQTMDGECSRTRRKKEQSSVVKKSLEAELYRLQGTLQSGWEATSSMEKECSESDQKVIDHMERLMKNLQSRRASVKVIEDRLQSELESMGNLKKGIQL